jgi:hypothetical protein
LALVSKVGNAPRTLGDRAAARGERTRLERQSMSRKIDQTAINRSMLADSLNELSEQRNSSDSNIGGTAIEESDPGRPEQPASTVCAPGLAGSIRTRPTANCRSVICDPCSTDCAQRHEPRKPEPARFSGPELGFACREQFDPVGRRIPRLLTTSKRSSSLSGRPR